MYKELILKEMQKKYTLFKENIFDSDDAFYDYLDDHLDYKINDEWKEFDCDVYKIVSSGSDGYNEIIAVMDNPRQIVANQMRLPSGKVIRSYHQHDYVVVEEDGEKYVVDGGEAYARRSDNGENCSVYADEPFVRVREYFVWGTRGKDNDGPFSWVLLCDMSDNHIENVLETQTQIPDWKKNMFITEQNFRKERK